MKIPINTKTMEELFPSKDKFKNWIEHYRNSEMDILEFLAMDKITTKDKVLIALKLMPINLVQKFARDCASRATASWASYAALNAAKASNHYTALTASKAALTAAKSSNSNYYTALTASYAAGLTAAKAASYTASYTASYAALTASSTASCPGRADVFACEAAYTSLADRASDEELELQLKSIAQLIEESK